MRFSNCIQGFIIIIIQSTNIYQVPSICQALRYVFGSQWKQHTHSLCFQEHSAIVIQIIRSKKYKEGDVETSTGAHNRWA